VFFAQFNIYNLENEGACKATSRPLRGYITLYWSAVGSETGKRFILSVHDSRHYALKNNLRAVKLVPRGHRRFFLCPWHGRLTALSILIGWFWGGIPVRFFKLIGLFLISRIFSSCSHKFKVIRKDVPTTMFSVFVISSFLITQFRRENDAISRRSKKMDW